MTVLTGNPFDDESSSPVKRTGGKNNNPFDSPVRSNVKSIQSARVEQQPTANVVKYAAVTEKTVSSPMEQNNNNNNNNAMNPQTSLSASATTTGGVADKRKLWRDSTTPTLTKEIMMLQQIIITTLLDYWNEWTKRNHHYR